MAARLERAYRDAQRMELHGGSRIVCMSDCHRGVGNRGDNFLPNRHLFLAALQYYYNRNYTYIELGDGDELWENRDLSRIMEIHREVFAVLSRFYCEGRLHMLYGNHDDDKKRRDTMNGFMGLEAKEGIVLVDRYHNREIFLVHGHQGDLMNDYLLPVTKTLVHSLWRPLELLGFADPTSAAENHKRRKKTEQRLAHFANRKQILLVAGHTHRSVLPVPGEDFYINDGSCVHPGGITALEIERGALSLVKWSTQVYAGRFLAIERTLLAGPYPWKDYWA